MITKPRSLKTKTQVKPVTWLHLSDLHLGCPGRALWWQVHDEFRKSLQEQVKRIGPPDLVLISGDLANKGVKKEYELVDLFLADLKHWLKDAGAERGPLILPVPGNHDLARPKGEKAYPYLILDRYNSDDSMAQDFRKKLWEGRATPAMIKQPFKEYTSWFRRAIQSQFDGGKHEHDLHLSRFPGDYSVEIHFKDRVALNLVGLNSAWMQYSGAQFEGKLELPLEQFHLALPGAEQQSGLKIFNSDKPALLMMHHPPGWLSEASRQAFHEAIYTPDRFNVCLFGHMHAGMSESISVFGGKPRYFFQSPSLLGLEKYGTELEQRSIGYSFGRLGSNGEVRVWPITRMELKGSAAKFVPDLRFDDAEKRQGSILCPAVKSRTSKSKTKKPKASRTIKNKNLTLYFQYVKDLTDHINIAGIGSGAGAVSTAARYPIESLYVPLKSNTPHAPSHMEERLHKTATAKKGKGSKTTREEQNTSVEELDMFRESMESRVELEELLSQHRLLFIEGQPGSGKTTFVRFIASMLARDLLEIP
ncbi:MAG: metallophosphoesterase, partial [Planctomycetota bacterium]